MDTSLRAAKVGDKAVIRVHQSHGGYAWRVVTIKRLNPKSLSTDDGSRWDYKTRRIVGDPGCGYPITIELWEEDRHPYEVDAAESRQLIVDLYNCRSGRSAKQLASVLPLLEEVVRKLR